MRFIFDKKKKGTISFVTWRFNLQFITREGEKELPLDPQWERLEASLAILRSLWHASGMWKVGPRNPAKRALGTEPEAPSWQGPPWAATPAPGRGLARGHLIRWWRTRAQRGLEQGTCCGQNEAWGSPSECGSWVDLCVDSTSSQGLENWGK